MLRTITMIFAPKKTHKRCPDLLWFLMTFSWDQNCLRLLLEQFIISLSSHSVSCGSTVSSLFPQETECDESNISHPQCWCPRTLSFMGTAASGLYFSSSQGSVCLASRACPSLSTPQGTDKEGYAHEGVQLLFQIWIYRAPSSFQ